MLALTLNLFKYYLALHLENKQHIPSCKSRRGIFPTNLLAQCLNKSLLWEGSVME